MMKVPEFKDPAVTKFLVEFMRDLEKSNKDYLSSVTANKSLLIHTPNTPNPIVWELTVNTSGALVITRLQG